MARHCENAQKVAEFLEQNDRVAWVNYCGLENNKYHKLAQKYMPNGSCGVIAFGLKGDKGGCHPFHGQPENDLHRHACGRRAHLCTAPGQPYPSPALRRTAPRSRRGSRPHPSFGGHRECGGHHRRHTAGTGCFEIGVSFVTAQDVLRTIAVFKNKGVI